MFVIPPKTRPAIYCGISDQEKTSQIKNGKDYSNIESRNFFCGRAKDLEIESDIRKEDVVRTIAMGNIQTLNSNKASLDINCGSVMVNDRFILTAAHCLESFDQSGEEEIRTIVIRGNTDWQEWIDIKRTFKHPYYKFPSSYNDVALTELGRRVIFDFDVMGDSPICLGRNKDLSGQEAMVQGYGLTEENKKASQVLETNVTIISNDECAQILRYNTTRSLVEKEALKRALNFGVVDEVLCTQGIADENESSFSGPCEGDSGGPCFTQESSKEGTKSTLVGIVSGGLVCGRNSPSWYTKVASVMPWIGCIIQAAERGFPSETVEVLCKKAAKKINRIKNPI